MADSVLFTDVGPRDGLQNQPKILTVSERLRLIEAIGAAGVRSIEVGSFVSPKAVPAMAGTDEVVAGLSRSDGVSYSALIPNMKGYQLARDAGVLVNDNGYQCAAAGIIDMFPHTAHVDARAGFNK